MTIGKMKIDMSHAVSGEAFFEHEDTNTNNCAFVPLCLAKNEKTCRIRRLIKHFFEHKDSKSQRKTL